MALFPFIRGIAFYRRVRAAIPAAGPIAFDRVARARVICDGPGCRILVVGGSLQGRGRGKLHHLLVIGVGDVHDTEWISGFGAPAVFRAVLLADFI